MIQIYVNGRELVLYKDTTVNLEFNNPLFSTDTIDGDIAYGFDIPVRGNEISLEFWHLPQSAVKRMFDCTIMVSGLQIASGKLVIQQSSSDSLTVSVICNPYPEGWRDRSIRDNESEEIIVSNDLDAHKESWKKFLKSTLDDDRIKFAPVINDEGYGDKNKDFGLYNGRSHGKICNRVVFDSSGNIVHISRDPFVRLFNASITLTDEEEGMYIERNQQCLLPQIRLGYILGNVFMNMGYRYLDRLSSNADLNPIYIQSLSPLDGTPIQYDEFTSGYYLYATRGNSEKNYYKVPSLGGKTYNPQGLMWKDYSQGQRYYGIKFQASGWYHVQCKIAPDITPEGEVFFKVAKWDNGNATLPQNSPQNVTVNVKIGNYANEKETYVFDDTIYIDSSYVGIELALGFWLNTSYYGDEQEIWINKGSTSITIESKSLDEISYNNIYRNRFHIAECFPNISNGDFIKAAIQSLGLALYINNNDRSVELVPFKDIKSSKAIDLTDMILIKETELEYPDQKQYKFRLSALSDKDVSEEKFIDDVNEVSDLPDPHENIGKLCYVLSHNSFFKAEKHECEDTIWRMEWVDQHTNRQDCSVGGTGDESVMKTEAKIPCSSPSYDYSKPIPYIPFTMRSLMFNSEEEPDSEVIMLYYRGLEKLGNSSLQYQDMTAVKGKEFSLNAKSGNTLCEKYIRDWRQLVSLSKTIKYKLYLPIVKALEIVQLLKPQECNPESQTRWIIVNNIKSMPKKISLQIDNNDGMVLCEIEAAHPA